MKRILIFIAVSVFFSPTLVRSNFQVTQLDTSNGFCNVDGIRVPVGTQAYIRDKCEKIECEDGVFHHFTCDYKNPSNSLCRLIAGDGQYPNCCPRNIKCENVFIAAITRN
nr:uncharacterized protein LOC107452677 [Parasteatoda tepidariorum]